MCSVCGAWRGGLGARLKGSTQRVALVYSALVVTVVMTGVKELVRGSILNELGQDITL